MAWFGELPSLRYNAPATAKSTNPSRQAYLESRPSSRNLALGVYFV